jgi:hypothetical protein
MSIKKKRALMHAAKLTELNSPGYRVAVHFGVEAVGTALQGEFREFSFFLLEQLALHRVDAGFLHPGGRYYKRVFAKANCKFIVGALGGIG